MSRQLATAGVDVYDGQCEQVPGTYSARSVETRLREVPRSCGPFQPTIPTTARFADLPALSGPYTACARHCSARVAQDIKMHHGPTLDRPTLPLRARFCQPHHRARNWQLGSRRLPDLTKRSIHRPRVAMHNPRQNRRWTSTTPTKVGTTHTCRGPGKLSRVESN